jgi:NADH-quinone oxidoreductase subunit E
MTSGLFSADQRAKFDSELAQILTHFPPDQKGAAMLPALHLLQSLKGWLPPEGLRYVAEKLEVSKERAFEVATFYTLFHTEKPGKYVIDVCTNLSCSLWGAEKLLAHLEGKLGVRAGEGNERWTLRETECLASCATAPCLQINQEHHESLTLPQVDEIIARLP